MTVNSSDTLPNLTASTRLLFRGCNRALRDKQKKISSNIGTLELSNGFPQNNESKYSEIKRAMLDAVVTEEKPVVEECLKSLGTVATDLLRQNGSSQIDRATVENGIYKLLLVFSKPTDVITDKQANKLLSAFGPFSASSARHARQLVGRLRDTLPQPPRCSADAASTHKKTPLWQRKDLHAILKTFGDKEKDGEDDSSSNHASMDTASLIRNGFANDIASSSTSSSSFTDDATLSSRCRFGDVVKFIQRRVDKAIDFVNFVAADAVTSSKPVDAVATASSSSFKPRSDSGQVAAIEASKSTEQGDPLDGVAWLLQRLSSDVRTTSAAPADESCRSVLALLSSKKSDEELQNDLFDLLGFEKFDLIQDILRNRAQLVHDFYSMTDVDTAGLADKNDVDTTEFTKLVGRKNTGVKPYGQIISVESEKEYQISKELRKGEKRLRRMHDKDRKYASDMEEFTNIDVMRQRELAREYQMAQNTPLFSRDRGWIDQTKYTYVFDSSLVARNSASFIAGSKILLPENVKRIDNKMFEEVTIEPSPPPPTDIGAERIKIADLDTQTQAAFRNTKQLNQIQTVVFEKAYKSNENLLICAPTGAGKTNIAMLCVLNILRQYTRQGVIHKGEFKIIYVAPMKALAAEMVRNFGARLEPLGIKVKELTGDMQLTKQEIMQTQMIVTTPEKWDVVTRKSTGDTGLSQLVRLLIIDEIHLLHDDRGPVIEALVARTLRQVEMSQCLIRIVGLSATLPNYIDVAQFLRVNPMEGLFFFDGRFRPVPLGQCFIGIKAPDYNSQMVHMDQVCYEKVLKYVREGHQVMVFVHARNATGKTASSLKEIANNRGHSTLFIPENTPSYGNAQKMISKTRNRQLSDLFTSGFSIHHAGLLRSDRNIVEKLFAEGHIKVLCCTATLAWGVNLPAHAVIIKGTNIYDAKRSSFVDLGILDVQQIFGRAGRPQFDTFGFGTIITTHNKLSLYLSLLTRQMPIESHFVDSLVDNLNAEIVLGTVSNVDEAVEWLSYTYLFVRMRKNPLVYGISYKDLQEDTSLLGYRRKLIIAVAQKLDRFRMIRFNERDGLFHPTDIGRIASYFYIKSETVEIINDELKDIMTDDLIFGLVSKSIEFREVKVREDEMDELETLYHTCHLPVPGGVENTHGKVNVLIQSHISRAFIDSFSLISDLSYVVQNTGRILRALFDMALRRNNAFLAGRILNLCKCVEQRLWLNHHALMQMVPALLRFETVDKLQSRRLSIDRIREMTADELGHMTHSNGGEIKAAMARLPLLGLESRVQPITRSVLRVYLEITPDYVWDDRVHGRGVEIFHIWVEDPESSLMYHREEFLLTKKQVVKKEMQQLMFTVPLSEPMPSQYLVRWISDRWLESDSTHVLMLSSLILPERHPPHTALLNLQPLSTSVLRNEQYQGLYKFKHFNAVQTQIFFCLYNTDENALIGAPTGSGKTVAAELAMFREFNKSSQSKIVYIAPLKALVKERIRDWKDRLEYRLGKSVVELTGDVTPDVQALGRAHVIVTTPEKWDGISRSWQNRAYVRDVALIVIDEIHLLGEDRGPVLEVIVSRTNFISGTTNHKVRIIGLSTALANARDLADWLAIKQMGLYNFQPSVRPVPLEVHISGFSDKHYCPRMATMNKPAFQAISTHSPTKPVLIFVSSRRQTRLTALDLIAYLAGSPNPKQWLHVAEDEIENIVQTVRDQNLKLTLSFGIGLHHAGLQENDRRVTEELFSTQKIQILIATATLAWGVNFPAHLVIIKGTEYYDGKTRRYVDFPITDVLQMMGRAGRPQFDDYGVAVVYVYDLKKEYYKKFLYEPFPVESSLLSVLSDHLNAEIVAGTIKTKQQAMDYLTWTYFYRRILINPSYYGLADAEQSTINSFLTSIIDKTLLELETSRCISIMEDDRSLVAENLGRIASYYYLSNKTVRLFSADMNSRSSGEDLLKLLTAVHEYNEIPVRHNEDATNSDLAKLCPLPVDPLTYDDSHTKAHLLFQAHFTRLKMPNTDYETDLKSVLDQAIRILQAILDVAAEQGWLATSIRVVQLLQMIVQARWIYDSPLTILPHIEPYMTPQFTYDSIPALQAACKRDSTILLNMVRGQLDPSESSDILKVLDMLPVMKMSVSIYGFWQGTQMTRSIVVPLQDTNVRQASYVRLHADQEYTLCVQIERLNATHNNYAYAPKFPKAKAEGWFLILGDTETPSGDLIALKRVTNLTRASARNRTDQGHSRRMKVDQKSSRMTTSLSFTTPPTPGRKIYTLFLLSDCYLGLDLQYDLYFDLAEPSIECQMNAEMSDQILSD